MLEEKQKQVDEQKELLNQVDAERDGVQAELDCKAESIMEFQGIRVVFFNFFRHFKKA